MMTQETYVHIMDLHRQGWTMKEIADETGFHPATISTRLRHGPPPVRRVVRDDAKVMTARWVERIAELIRAYPRLLGISVFRCLVADGFEGGYSTVTRELRRVRGPRFTAADRVSVPIHTDPGEEAQFDFCVLDDWAARWGWPRGLRCFGMILCWSRTRIWWFTTSEDRNHTFEGMTRFFETVGGVPAACRTDRMGALGRSQGARFVLHPPVIEFTAHYRTKITSCKARDAKRKGKIERPFRQLQETFLPELEATTGTPVDLAELNQRAAVWLDANVHSVPSRATGARPVDRLIVERPFLGQVPTDRWDTDYVESRRVHNIVPFVSIGGSRYSVPPETLGQAVEIRRPVDANQVQIRWAGRLVATHTLVTGHNLEIWNPAHRHAAETTAKNNRTDRPALRVITNPTPPTPTTASTGYDIDPVDLAARYPITINPDNGPADTEATRP